jgi:hypothetical protein
MKTNSLIVQNLKGMRDTTSSEEKDLEITYLGGQPLLKSESRNSSISAESPQGCEFSITGPSRDEFELLKAAAGKVMGIPLASEAGVGHEFEARSRLEWSFWCLVRTSCRPKLFPHFEQVKGFCLESDVRLDKCENLQKYRSVLTTP